MGILAFLCIFLGLFPKILYDMLPYPVEFVPYTITRVFSVAQMFILTFLGFWFLRRWLVGHPTYVLDSDWFVRIPGMKLLQFCNGPLLNFGSYLDQSVVKATNSFVSTDNLYAFSGYHKHRKKILASGVNIFEYRPHPEIQPALMGVERRMVICSSWGA